MNCEQSVLPNQKAIQLKQCNKCRKEISPTEWEVLGLEETDLNKEIEASSKQYLAFLRHQLRLLSRTSLKLSQKLLQQQSQLQLGALKIDKLSQRQSSLTLQNNSLKKELSSLLQRFSKVQSNSPEMHQVQSQTSLLRSGSPNNISEIYVGSDSLISPDIAEKLQQSQKRYQKLQFEFEEMQKQIEIWIQKDIKQRKTIRQLKIEINYLKERYEAVTKDERQLEHAVIDRFKNILEDHLKKIRQAEPKEWQNFICLKKKAVLKKLENEYQLWVQQKGRIE